MGMTLINIFLCLLVWSLVYAGGNVNNVEAGCNATYTSRVEYEFNTDIVNTEHIIMYKGYFPRSTRENYINAALRNAGVSFSYTFSRIFPGFDRALLGPIQPVSLNGVKVFL